jgi:hypothetical protein
MPRTVKRTSKQSATRSPLYPIQQLVKKETTTNKPRVCDATAVGTNGLTLHILVLIH